MIITYLGFQSIPAYFKIYSKIVYNFYWGIGLIGRAVHRGQVSVRIRYSQQRLSVRPNVLSRKFGGESLFIIGDLII